MQLILLLALFAQTAERLENWHELAMVSIQADLHHVQGIDIEGNTLWVSSVDAKAGKGFLSKIETPSGRLIAQVEVQQGKRIHPGGITLDGDSIWIPVAEYDRDGPSTIERRNKKTLALESSFEVNDHIGCVAAGKTFLIGGSWSSRTLYQWTKSGEQMLKVSNPIATSWQDLKMDGDLLMGSGQISREQGAVDWVSIPEFKLVRRITTGATDRRFSYAHEGMTYRNGKLYFLPEDAPSRLFAFEAR
ncbi:MAG: DUF6454 family protein [Acidobacteria bacterium]|nr:DUF6454 family protein [Acidobacteriota bacterium]